jgi:hypothetical protein
MPTQKSEGWCSFFIAGKLPVALGDLPVAPLDLRQINVTEIPLAFMPFARMFSLQNLTKVKK